MNMFTVACLAIGAIVVGGSLVFAGVNYSISKKEAPGKIAELRDSIKVIEEEINNMEALKTELSNAKNYLISSKNSFTNGGWVNNGIPLANNEFSTSIGSLDTAISECDKYIANCRSLINGANDQISQLQTLL